MRRIGRAILYALGIVAGAVIALIFGGPGVGGRDYRPPPPPPDRG